MIHNFLLLISYPHEQTSSVRHTEELIGRPYEIANIIRYTLVKVYGRLHISFVWHLTWDLQSHLYDLTTFVAMPYGRRIDCPTCHRCIVVIKSNMTYQVKYMTWYTYVTRRSDLLQHYTHKYHTDDLLTPPYGIIAAWHRNDFHITSSLWRKSSSHRYIPLTNGISNVIHQFSLLSDWKNYGWTNSQVVGGCAVFKPYGWVSEWPVWDDPCTRVRHPYDLTGVYLVHYNDVTWTLSCLKSPTTRLFAHVFELSVNKGNAKAPHTSPLGVAIIYD